MVERFEDYKAIEKAQRSKFLEDVATQCKFTGDTRTAFMSRFHPDNADKTNAQLAKSYIAWNNAPDDKEQKLQDELRRICQVLEQVGCQIKRDNNKPGRLPKGESPWEQAYSWVWLDKFLQWQQKQSLKQTIYPNSYETINADKIASLIKLLEFCHIPAGAFFMGSSDEDPMAYPDEKPQHELTISYDYWMGRYPVTVAQWRAYLDSTRHSPHYPESREDEGDTRPARFIKFNEAVDFCDWLTAQLKKWADSSQQPLVRGAGRLFWNYIREGRIVVTIPSEPEWEKAARGTDKRIYPWEGDIKSECANFERNKVGTTVPVTKHEKLNVSPYGCVDMVGNLWEWTRTVTDDNRRNWDQAYDVIYNGHPPYPYPLGDRTKDWESLDKDDSRRRIRKGGSFFHDEQIVRIALRCGNPPEDGEYKREVVGFRVAVVPKSVLLESVLP